MKTLFLLIALVASPIFAQTTDDYVAPRTEWGQPDLQGVGILILVHQCSVLSDLERGSF